MQTALRTAYSPVGVDRVNTLKIDTEAHLMRSTILHILDPVNQTRVIRGGSQRDAIGQGMMILPDMTRVMVLSNGDQRANPFTHGTGAPETCMSPRTHSSQAGVGLHK